jgi:hypothetical protein
MIPDGSSLVKLPYGYGLSGQYWIGRLSRLGLKEKQGLVFFETKPCFKQKKGRIVGAPPNELAIVAALISWRGNNDH